MQKDARPVKLPELLPANVDLTVTDTVLLRVLVHGSQYTLFELVDEKAHYFIKSNDHEIKELTYKVASLENGSLSEQKIFIGQLKALLQNSDVSPTLLRKIDAAQYKEKYLTSIVKEMNKISGSVEYVVPLASKKLTTSFFAGVGGGYSSIKFSGSHAIFGHMKYSGRFVPFATIGVDIASARNLQAVVFRPELSFSTASYKGNGQNVGYTNSYEVSQFNISPSFALLYNFIRKESFRVYIGGGAAYNISFYPKNLYTQVYTATGTKQTDDYLDYPKGWLSLSAKLGVKLNNRLEAGINGQLLGSFTNYIAWGFSANTYTAQVRYFFN